jgi:hypothetical protein
MDNIQDLMDNWEAAGLKALEAERATWRAGLEVRQALSQMLGTHTVPGCDGVVVTNVCANAIVIGNWDCTDSPIEVCVYDSYEDPVQDSCLYCHAPDERK